jgi:hypothetical protein
MTVPAAHHWRAIVVIASGMPIHHLADGRQHHS